MKTYYYIEALGEGTYIKSYTLAVSVQNHLYKHHQKVYPIRKRTINDIPNNHIKYISELNNSKVDMVNFKLKTLA